ncbi:MAG: hypothetical protein PUP92_31970 [Rhizonema sp. PD38]|nr:hypothetical protein [Rhizonema sp. PD38]
MTKKYMFTTFDLLLMVVTGLILQGETSFWRTRINSLTGMITFFNELVTE